MRKVEERSNALEAVAVVAGRAHATQRQREFGGADAFCQFANVGGVGNADRGGQRGQEPRSGFERQQGQQPLDAVSLFVAQWAYHWTDMVIAIAIARMGTRIASAAGVLKVHIDGITSD